MPDRFFYPFAALLIAAIIFTALSFSGTLREPVSREAIIRDGFSVEGEGLRALVASPGTQVSFETDANGLIMHAVLSAQTARNLAPPSAGIFIELGPEYEAAFKGRKLRVSALVKAGETLPTESFTFQYYAVGGGQSQEARFPVTNSYEPLSFDYVLPAKRQAPAADYVGIWPDIEGKNRTLYLKRIRVELIDKP